MREYGSAIITDPYGSLEIPTFTCAHCCRVTEIEGGNMGGCYRCGPTNPICIPCAKLGTCAPFEKWLEQVERNA